jgi:hypothetical protein
MGVFKKVENLQYKIFDKNISLKPLLLLTSIAVIIYLLCGGSLLAGGFNPFIYFRF